MPTDPTRRGSELHDDDHSVADAIPDERVLIPQQRRPGRHPGHSATQVQHRHRWVKRGSIAAVVALAAVSVPAVAGLLTGGTATAQGRVIASPPGVGSAAVASMASGLVALSTGTSVPSGWAGRIGALTGVSAAVPVVEGTVWMTGSLDATGHPVDSEPTGRGIPLDLRAADVANYARLASPQVAAQFTGLQAGQALLGATSAKLRRIGPGGTLVVGGVRLQVVGVVPDADVGYAEAFTTPATAARAGVTSTQYLLVQPSAGTTSDQLDTRIRSAVGSSTAVSLAQADTSYGADDSVLPQVLEKLYFGEFTVDLRSRAGGQLSPDANWTASHLTTEAVPILGRVTCNTAMLPALRAALTELVQQGLSNLVNPRNYGGCYAARTVAGLSTDAISHHAWGSAIDLNVSRNPRGGPSHQDSRLIAIFRQYGFTWGGDWAWPDPMHFELLTPPTA